jgi:4-oxalocrotonate tautomerase
MPNISIEGPQLADIEVKRRLVSEMTAAAVRAYNLAREAIVIVIKENPPENVGVGGKLIADLQPKEPGKGN